MALYCIITLLYSILFPSIYPGGALLEATLKEHLSVYELTAEVFRINQYGNQSHCINHQVLRKYCLCYDMVE